MIVTKDREIIITDPCYFAKDKDWCSNDGLGFFIGNDGNCAINLPEFSDYIWINTGFGDGSGRVFKSDKPGNQYELEEKIISLRKHDGQDRVYKEIGKFGVDSGTFGVFFYDEVLKYYPDFAMEIGSWCYTILKDFEGTVYATSIDDSDERESELEYCYNYLIGSGNKSFCTIW